MNKNVNVAITEQAWLKCMYTKEPNFRLVLIESICRQWNKYDSNNWNFTFVENILEKVENAGYKHDLMSHNVFKRLLS